MAYKDKQQWMEYQREYQAKWYRKHKERLLEKRRQHDEELKKWLSEYKSQLCCVECGESHPACLQFHHRNKDEKRFTIGHDLGRWRYITLKKLEEEINKIQPNNLEILNRKSYILHNVCMNCNITPQILKILLDKNLDVNIRDDNKDIALHIAVKNDSM